MQENVRLNKDDLMNDQIKKYDYHHLQLLNMEKMEIIRIS